MEREAGVVQHQHGSYIANQHTRKLGRQPAHKEAKRPQPAYRKLHPLPVMLYFTISSIFQANKY